MPKKSNHFYNFFLSLHKTIFKKHHNPINITELMPELTINDLKKGFIVKLDNGKNIPISGHDFENFVLRQIIKYKQQFNANA
jgi:hypothetical protein